MAADTAPGTLGARIPDGVFSSPPKSWGLTTRHFNLASGTRAPPRGSSCNSYRGSARHPTTSTAPTPGRPWPAPGPGTRSPGPVKCHDAQRQLGSRTLATLPRQLPGDKADRRPRGSGWESTTPQPVRHGLSLLPGLAHQRDVQRALWQTNRPPPTHRGSGCASPCLGPPGDPAPCWSGSGPLTGRQGGETHTP